MISLTVFLGNPGKDYSKNRHNAGFLLAEKSNLTSSLSWHKKYKALYAFLERKSLTGYLPDSDPAAGDAGLMHELSPQLYFIKPQTYMNLSGDSVSAIASFYKITINNILIVHDELELPLGTFSLKDGGGLGGHNGLRSIKASLGSADFWRLRIGIGRPDAQSAGKSGSKGKGVVDWVLSNFDPEEEETLEKVMDAAGELLLRSLLCKPESLLGEWAKKKIV
jgi:PTH1 family peptidyl-tRNA hydrolase